MWDHGTGHERGAASCQGVFAVLPGVVSRGKPCRANTRDILQGMCQPTALIHGGGLLDFMGKTQLVKEPKDSDFQHKALR